MLNLLQKQFIFSRLVPKLLDKAHSLGFNVSLGEVLRSPQQAKLNAQSGAGISNSLHIISLALDLKLFKGSDWIEESEPYKPLGDYWISLSTPEYECCWGGNFKDRLGRPKPDGGHFSISHNGVK